MRRIGLLTGPLAALILLVSEPPDNLSVQGWQAMAIAIWMMVVTSILITIGTKLFGLN